MPHPTLTRITGKPDYISLNTLKRELTANAAAVMTHSGNGQLGFLALIIGVAEYNQMVGANVTNHWVDPVQPPTQPVLPAGNATNRVIAEATNAWKADMKNFDKYVECKQILKKQLLEAVDKTYVCSLDHEILGYTNVTVRQLIEHLEATYATLDVDVLNANSAKLDDAWIPEESMEPLWRKCRDIQRVSRAGAVEITDAMVMNKMHNVLKSSGVFALDMRDWDKRDAAQKTWPLFQTFFTEANKERLKTATASDLQHSANSATGTTGATSSSGTPGGSPPTSTGSTTTNGSLAYCWSHGAGPNHNHTSMTCTRKATGHQEAATITNMMGGNNTIRRKRGEKNTFRALNPPTPRGERPATPVATPATPPAAGAATPTGTANAAAGQQDNP